MENLLRDQSEETSFLDCNTNEVLVEELEEKTIYYLPCYVRMKVKSVKQLDIESLSGTVSGTLLFSFYYGNLPISILEQFTGEGSKAILLQLSRQESIQLREDKGIIFKQQPGTKVIDYVVRTEFDCQLEGDVFLTPFEILNLHLAITAQTVILDPKKNQGKRINIKFNCMNSYKVTTIDSSSDLEFGTYCLADYYLDSDYTNSANHRFCPVSVWQPEKKRLEKEEKPQKKGKETESKNVGETSDVKMILGELPGVKVIKKKHLQIKAQIEQLERSKKVKHFQYTHFRIPLYKNPGSSLLSIFIPLWVIAFINLVTFFQDNKLADRMAVIATVSLAFIAFLPTINQKIPQTNTVNFVEILIYIETGLTLLTMIDSLAIRFQNNETYAMNWRENGFFLTALIINILIIVTVVLLYVLHKVWWQNVYNREREIKITTKLITDHWGNDECDEQFRKWLASKKIVHLGPQFPKVKVQPPQQ